MWNEIIARGSMMHSNQMMVTIVIWLKKRAGLQQMVRDSQFVVESPSFIRNTKLGIKPHRVVAFEQG